MNSELTSLIDEYIEKFLSQTKVKQYFILEEQINNSEEIKLLQENLKKSQKELALSINNEKLHQEKLIEYNKNKKAFDEHPLVCNYNLLKEEIYLKLKEFEMKIKE